MSALALRLSASQMYDPGMKFQVVMDNDNRQPSRDRRSSAAKLRAGRFASMIGAIEVFTEELISIPGP